MQLSTKEICKYHKKESYLPDHPKKKKNNKKKENAFINSDKMKAIY